MSGSGPFANLAARRLAASATIPLSVCVILCSATIQAGAQPVSGGSGPPDSRETYLWKPVAIGGGGYITGYDVDPSGQTRVARTDVHGAYLWLDGENRWAQLATSATMPEAYRVQNGMSGGVYEIVVAPSDPARIYMAAKGTVFRSSDRGRSFEDTGPRPPFPFRFDPNGRTRNYGPFLSVSPADPDLVFFGTPADGLWHSADGGAHWSHVRSVPSAADLKAETPDLKRAGIITWFERSADGPTGRIWAMSPGYGMFVSADGGATFEAQSPPDAVQPEHLTQGAFAPDGRFFGVDLLTKTAWLFRNGEWRNLSEQGDLPSARFAAVAVDPRTGLVLVFDEGGEAYRSNDSGETWVAIAHRSRVGEGDPPWLRVSNQSYFAMSRVQFDPVVPGRIWTGAGTGVFYADVTMGSVVVDWISQTRGIEELVTTDIAQTPGQPPMFAALDFGVHVKDDLDAYSTTFGPRERVLIAVQKLATSPADPAFVATNASDTRTSCCWQDGDAVMAGYSLDAGRSWTKFAALPQPPGTLAGDPWRMSFGSLAVSAGDTQNIVWEPSYNRSPFYTLDRGRTWNRVVLPGERLPNTGSHPTIYLPRKALTADGARSGVFYLVHSGGGENAGLTGLWRTQNGGAEWTRVLRGEIAPNSRYAAKLRAVPGRAGHLFFTAGVADGKDTILRRSRDGGASWAKVVDVDHVDDLAFGKAAPGAEEPTIYLSGRVKGRYGIWRSTDNARSWNQLAAFPLGSLDQVTVIGADPDRFGRVYVGYMGSGFIYGEPAPCEPKPLEPLSASQCTAID